MEKISTERSLRILGLFLFVIGCITIGAIFLKGFLFSFIEDYVIKLDPIRIQTIILNVFFIAFFITVIGFILWRKSDVLLQWSVVKEIIEPIQNDKARGRVGDDTGLFTIFLLSTAIGIVTYVAFKFANNYKYLYREGGLVENLPSLLFFISAVLTFKAAFVIRKHNKLFLFLYLGLALFFFLFSMEEISWGQWIFHWETPEAFDLNFQKETNIHNFANPTLILLNVENLLSVILVIAVFLAGWGKYQNSKFIDFVFPHPSLIGLAFIAAVATGGELMEELVAIFALFYSWRVSSIAKIYNPEIS